MTEFQEKEGLDMLTEFQEGTGVKRLKDTLEHARFMTESFRLLLDVKKNKLNYSEFQYLQELAKCIYGDMNVIMEKLFKALGDYR